MKINVAQIKQSIGACQSFNFHIPVDLFDTLKHLPWLTGELAVSGQAVNTGRVISISGVIHGTAHHTCNRCLQEYSREIDVSFSENYQEQGASAINDPDILYFSGDEIDIAESLRDTLILAEPLKPLCADTCRGLCLKCGTDLNTAECGCDTDVLDPRMAALKKLLEKK